jgi:colicin import membrane protein
MFGQATDAEIEKYKAAAEAKKAADQEVFNAARQIAIDKADLTFNLTQSPEAYIAEQAKKAEADKVKADADAAEEKKKVADRIALYGTASTAEIDAYNATKAAKAAADQAEFDAARQRAIDLGDLNFNLAQSAADFAAGERAKEKAAHDEKVNMLTAGFQEYGKLAGDQLAAGEKASVVAEKLAKKALGAQISALGDKAMVEAAIYAAAFNPMAIPMAAAGVAAYTAAAALGAEGKKATTATPAAAAPAAGPVNTAFNLRVDAAFADGESIARQFAMMQRSAQRRGLVPVGA